MVIDAIATPLLGAAAGSRQGELVCDTNTKDDKRPRGLSLRSRLLLSFIRGKGAGTNTALAQVLSYG